MAAAEHRLLDTGYDEYEDNNTPTGASLCRSVAIILMALLLLIHALTIGDVDNDEDDDPTTFFAETFFFFFIHRFLLLHILMICNIIDSFSCFGQLGFYFLVT